MNQAPFSLIEHSDKVTDTLGLRHCYSIGFPEVQSPQASIVIPVFNQLGYTLKCLFSLVRHPQRASFEVIVVDDGSDLSVFRALSEIPGLRVIRNFANQGFVRSCNRGVLHAHGEHVVMLNNDTEVTEGWLDSLLRVFTLRPDAGLVGAKLVYPDGSLQEAGGIIWNDASGWNYGRNDDPQLPWYNYLREVDYCSGACIVLKKAVWDRLDGFDLHFAPAYYEDTDLAFRVREIGLKVYYQPHARVVHHEGKSNGLSLQSGVKQNQVVNAGRFQARWAKALASHYVNADCVFRARERSRARTTILIIDHYLPHFDQDAGSRNIYNYLLLFLSAGFSVKFIGDNFYPHEPYQTHLQELGVEVLTGSWMRDHWEEWLARNGSDLDYVLFSRALTCARWVEPVRRHSRAKLLFYGHDLISRTLRRAYQDFGDSSHLRQSEEWQAKEDYIIGACDASFYPSPLEVDELRTRFPGKSIECVPLYMFEPRDRSSDLPSALRSDLVFVGSFGHPPNVDALQWMLTEVMPELRKHIPDICLHVVGKNPPERLVRMGAELSRFHGYLSDAALHDLLGRCRVSVAPLRMGGGIKGKILEAWYRGIPVATTCIGIEGIDVGGCGCLVVDQNDRFAERLAEYYQDTERLDLASEAAYRAVLAMCSKEALQCAFATAIPEFAMILSTKTEA